MPRGLPISPKRHFNNRAAYALANLSCRIGALLRRAEDYPPPACIWLALVAVVLFLRGYGDKFAKFGSYECLRR